MRTKFKKKRFIDTGDIDTSGYYDYIELEHRDITLFCKSFAETLCFATPEEAFKTYMKYITEARKAYDEDVENYKRLRNKYPNHTWMWTKKTYNHFKEQL